MALWWHMCLEAHSCDQSQCVPASLESAPEQTSNHHRFVERQRLFITDHWLTYQRPKCGSAVRWQHESWTSGHHHWLPGTSYSDLSQSQDFGLTWHWTRIEICGWIYDPYMVSHHYSQQSFLDCAVAILSKISWATIQFHMVFQTVTGVTEIIKLPIWRNQTLQMDGKLEVFPLYGALFGLESYNDPCVMREERQHSQHWMPAVHLER